MKEVPVMAKIIFKRVLDFLFPPRCVFCRKILKNSEHEMCDECQKQLPYTNGTSVRLKGEFFTECVSPLLYSGNVRKSFLRFKFKNATNYAGCYGKLLANCVRDNMNGKFDLITWVPLSAKRQKKRGYDQAMLIAMVVALELDYVAVEILVKHTDIPAQSGLRAAEERRANVLGAFGVIDSELVCGKRILLIDDIVTTGATLSECSQVLLAAGASEVS
jgi:ComF family protein